MSVAQQEVAKASNELFEGGLWWVWGFRGSAVLRVLWGGLGRLGHWGSSRYGPGSGFEFRDFSSALWATF